jgi:hypothetical protein
VLFLFKRRVVHAVQWPWPRLGQYPALLELLKSHRCEESAARLLEALINTARVRERKLVKYAIAPLSLRISKLSFW